MGQCGCGDFHGDFRFKGPGGDWYVLQVYFPCQYCDTPAGVIIYRMNKEDQKLWDVKSIREVEILDIGSCFSVVDAPMLMKEIRMEDDGPDFHCAIRKACQSSVNNNNEMYDRAEKLSENGAR